ncbi:MAG: hypothetical protein HC814_06735 [Rhodobacteraceae bacterium]|nr:hypothetical protein [Paracoccaceae bacterium]
MRFRCFRFSCSLLLLAFATVSGCRDATTAVREFTVRGVVVEVRVGGASAVIRHEAIPGYMAAMTMPFQAKATNELTGIQPGDEIEFRFVVTPEESWMERVRRTGRVAESPTAKTQAVPALTPAETAPLLAGLVADMVFTNELGQAVRWSDFDGKAIGFTFLFTRCPVPDYCPRLAKNFAAATHRLQSMPGAPTNWHLLALTIDPVFDTPVVLRNYAKFHGADPARWSLLTTTPDATARFARLFGLGYEPVSGTIEHDFRTVIVDATGRVQAVWPISGDTTDALVTELIKARV